MKMKLNSVLCVIVVACGASITDAELTCSECISEMQSLGDFVRKSGASISRFLVDNYCPTVDSPSCANNLIKHYVPALYMVTQRFITDDAKYICKLMMVCDARRRREEMEEMKEPASKAFTCHDCIEGLKFIDRYLLDEFVVDEFIVYLEENFCLPDMEACVQAVRNHFPAMHRMAMKQFFKPREICIQQDVCDP